MRPEKYPRWDACLQIHDERVYSSPNNWVNPGYWDWLQQPHGKKIWMQRVDPRVPDSVRYPLEEVLQLVPYRYLRSSPAMALALAIYLGYDEIQLYGSELSSNTEYAYQATNYAFWIGFAHGRGIDLRLRCWLDEFNQPIYGYEGELQLDKDFFAQRVAEHEAALASHKSMRRKIESRMQEAMLAADYDEAGEQSLKLIDIAILEGAAQGQLSEAQRYAARQDMISRQEYERVSAQAQLDGDRLRTDKDHAGGKCEYVWNVWKQTGAHQALEQFRRFVDERARIAHDMGVKKGMYEENILYMLEYDRRLQAAGGVRALGRPEEYRGPQR